MVDEPIWNVSYAECGPCPPLDGTSDPDRARWERMAVDYLWNWTGRAYGLTQVTVRPCLSLTHRDSTFGGRGFMFQPALIGGLWFNLGCGYCGTYCSCRAPASVRLPGPVDLIVTVRVDGALLPTSAYRLRAGLLERLDGGVWPFRQDLTAPTTAPGTFEVTYLRGLAVPPGGELAAGMLACELAKSACNDSSCRLPQRIQTITRQGVTVAMLDPMEGTEKGRTGIWLIDSWVASVMNPPARGRVYSVDRPDERSWSGRPWT